MALNWQNLGSLANAPCFAASHANVTYHVSLERPNPPKVTLRYTTDVPTCWWPLTVGDSRLSRLWLQSPEDSHPKLNDLNDLNVWMVSF